VPQPPGCPQDARSSRPPDSPRPPDLSHEERPPSQEPSIWDVPERFRAPDDWDPHAEPSEAQERADDAVRRTPARTTSAPSARRRRLLIIAVAAVVLLAAVTATAVALTRGDGTAKSGGSGPAAAEDSPSPAPASSRDPFASPASSPQASASAAEPSEAAVPILMYHLIAVAPAAAAYPDLYVRPATFAAQMKYLHDEGYQAVSLGRVFDAWAGAATLPDRPVVISFDDGYPSHYLVAAPIMQQYGWKGLLNADWKVLDESPRLLAQVRLLAAAGWEIGSHSLTHPDLTTLDADRLEEEAAGSREVLREQLAVAVDFFCYPAGRYDDDVVAAVEAAGYRGATTTDRGLATRDEPFRLKRVRVSDSLSPAQLAAAMRSDSP